MKRTGPTGRAKSVHTRREVYMPRTPNIREDTRRSFNPTSINSADHSLMPTTATLTSDVQRRPDARIFNAGRHGPTHHSLSLSLPHPLCYD